MNKEKIQCPKCNAKFLILDRKEIQCTQCGFSIIVPNLNTKIPPSFNKEEFLENDNKKDQDILSDDFESEE